MNDDEAFQLLPARGLPPPSALRVVGSTIVVLAIPTGAGVLFYYERGIWTDRKQPPYCSPHYLCTPWVPSPT